MAIKTVQLPGLRMDYIVFGQGKKPMVVLPGMSLLPVVDSAAAVEAALGLFAEEYTVYVFERTADMTEGYTVPQMAEDTARAMEALGLSGCYTFGTSQGGMLAMCIAMEHPLLIKKLVLGSTLAKPNEMSRATFPHWAALADSKDVVRINRETLRIIYSPAYLASISELLPAIEQQGSAEDCARYAILARSIIEFDVYDRLTEIQCPTLVLGSRQDNVLSVEGSIQIAEKLHCPMYLYDGYSHAVCDEAPDYMERVRAFFSE